MRFAVLGSVLSLAACAKQEILHELDERDANEIVVLLSETQPPIAAAKLPDVSGGGGGNKGPKFLISVPAADATAAWKILTDHQLPRRKDAGRSDIITGGLIPTATEEKAKTMMAIEGELAHTLKLIDGVLDARVHVVIPERSVLQVKEEDKADATASVMYKYVPRGKNQQ
jgi:type III secretion protein J